MQSRNLARLLLILLGLISLFEGCKHVLPIPLADDGGGGGTVSASCSPDSVYFQQQVLPIIVSNCTMSGCHDAVTRKEGLDLTTYNGIMRIVQAGNPAESKLYQVIVTGSGEDRMPPFPYAGIPQSQVDLIFNWIKQGAKNNGCSNMCDSTIFTFSGAIMPLIAAQCQGCHSGSSASGGIDLTTYSGVKAVANDGKLWGAINKNAGYTPMPPSGPGLSECQLTQFRKWIENGSPDN